MARPLPRWAQDASLGIFVHWGAYSVPAWAEPTGALGAVPDDEWFTHNAYAEWYANTIRIDGSPAAVRHERVHGGAPYEEFLDEWRADEYDPAAWARLFASLGADYVVPTTKHHDGIALWDAPGSDRLSTVGRGPRRDLIGPLADAVRAEGLRFGVYYSGGLDWHFAEHPPITASDQLSRFRPVDGAYNEYTFEHVADLVRRYRPDLVWNDIDWPDAGKRPGPHSLEVLLGGYRAAVPDGIVNDRWGAPVGDYRTSEYEHDTGNETGAGWEQCRGLGFSFGYNQAEDDSLTLSPRELARLYADTVSRGGRLLLNVGPTASGLIPDIQLRTLDGVAPWMRELKPHTIGRATIGSDTVEVRDRAGAPVWSRSWHAGERIVVVTEHAGLDIRAPRDAELVVLPLPE
ncbi:alpha-L-fucosidase [Lysobacter korlensis]|uniref:alpha-L-fucosidase n=1 Tax=Lysobacter korlensis TaxID=553636 RepID=A0ABV6RY20_9GAMM